MRPPLMLASLFAMTCENAIVPLERGDTAAVEDSGGLGTDTAGPLEECAIPSVPVGTWTTAFDADTSCTCEDNGPMCHGLYDAQVVSIDGPLATLRFQKWDDSPAQTTFHYWVGDFGVVVPECDSLAAPVVLAEGEWPGGDGSLEVVVELWTEDELRSGAAPERSVALFSGGSGNVEERVWFQPFAIDFRWDCSGR